MYLSRMVVKNYRNLKEIDASLNSAVNCVIGENNSGKSNLLHALRLCLDVNLPSTFRSLAPSDVHADVDQSQPHHVLIGVEFADYSENLNELALLHACQIDSNRARIFFRYRPKKVIREAITAREQDPNELRPEDYGWDLYGGGNPSLDLTELNWNDDVGEPIRFSDLQYFQVVTLPALRDVEYDLRNGRLSPLVKLLDATDIPKEEQDQFVEALITANANISASRPVSSTAKGIGSTLATATGPSYEIEVGIGIGDPTYQTILRSLRVLLSEKGALQNIDPSRNGLGLNNVLYIAIWLEYLSKRIQRPGNAGQVILIEEPEAHLHPQLQMTLMAALERLSLQSLVTTHSTHITSRMPLSSYVVMTKDGNAIRSHALSSSELVSRDEQKDLERYLDATKSTLLFARKVILVEGAAELILLPPMIKEMSEIDLEHHGITVIAVNGTHFGPFAKLFSDGKLGKRCAIVGDADLPPSPYDDDGEAVTETKAHLLALESDTVKVFLGRTTFEREIAEIENARMIIAAVASSGLVKASDRLRRIAEQAEAVRPRTPERYALEEEFRVVTLKTSIRIGKARFAQRCAAEVGKSVVLPQYIADAVDWLTRK
jgi:putative ATP-dependent endonuclease of the OLD family